MYSVGDTAKVIKGCDSNFEVNICNFL